MNSKRTMWILICAAVLLLMAKGQVDLVLIAAPLSLLVGYLATGAAQRKIWSRK